ncbi:MAG TPA: hypothetical protein GXZ98_07035 [Firmicutes bacterium]|jgi:hypothetical protein|nr:hypothetical protein [Bacillota bacterium]
MWGRNEHKQWCPSIDYPLLIIQENMTTIQKKQAAASQVNDLRGPQDREPVDMFFTVVRRV